MSPRTRLALVLVALVLVPVVYVGCQAGQALVALEGVERERDTWQRPQDIISALDLQPGDVVVDLGSGAGYFALRLAPVVGRGGRVIAVDILRQPLVFLWLRTLSRRQWNVDVVLGTANDLRLRTSVDGALIVNTYHELTEPTPILDQLFGSMNAGGRLAVADRRPREPSSLSDAAERASHRLSPDIAEREILGAGFQALSRDDHFIDRAGDDPWWLMVFRKP